MDKLYIVTSLEDICFDVSFKEITATLNQCYNQLPEENKSSAFSQSKSEELVRLVRGRLDQLLVGKVSKEVREKYAKRFYGILSNPDEVNRIDAWLFLDAVLDATCTELDVFLPGDEPCSKLMSTIVKRSPLLKELTINFLATTRPTTSSPFPGSGHVRALSCSYDRKEIIEDVIMPLNSLQHLTHLSLLDINGDARFTALCLIGKACPSITHLTVSGELWSKIDVLALILGESGIIMFDSQKCYERLSSPWCADQALDHLLLPCEHLSPICFTLRQLHFKKPMFRGNKVRASEAAFALRHLPLLEVAHDEVFPASLAVTHLHQNVGNTIDQEESFEKFKKAYQESLPKKPSRPRKSIPTFSGQLFLTKLDCVDLINEQMLRAIGAMCPKLKEVTFKTEFFYRNLDFEVTKSILSDWPKLSSITFDMVHHDHVTPVLEVFGAELQQLEVMCRDVKLADLALCSKLESLSLHKSRLEPHEIDPATFLPNLKSFQTEICLGPYSLLFEEKSTLVRLVLNCSHVKIQHTAQTSSDSELDRIHQMWSHLEILSIWSFAQLTMSDISKLIPRLLCLKLVILPLGIEMFDRALYYSVWDHLLGRSPPAKIHFPKNEMSYLAVMLTECKIKKLPNQ